MSQWEEKGETDRTMEKSYSGFALCNSYHLPFHNEKDTAG